MRAITAMVGGRCLMCGCVQTPLHTQCLSCGGVVLDAHTEYYGAFGGYSVSFSFRHFSVHKSSRVPFKYLGPLYMM